MGDLFSIRMRAAKEKKGRRTSHKLQPPDYEHISGAEGIYAKPDVNKVLREYTQRAMEHPRGRPDEIVITVERLRRKPRSVPLLPLTELRCNSRKQAREAVLKILQSTGISGKALKTAFQVIDSGQTLRGATLISVRSGRRLEPDMHKGVRVSCFGIDKGTSRVLESGLSRAGINTGAVREALVLASKVASCHDIAAELCISDDPDYTTGYIASGETGYLRIPFIKKRGSRAGGRAFFVKQKADTGSIIEYLKYMPLIAGKSFCYKGIMSVDEILCNTYR